MALSNYGVLKGRIVDFDGERTDKKSPHLMIDIDADGKHFRAAVNVKSGEAPSEVVYLAVENYAHPQLALYPPLDAGFTKLENRAGSGALDYIRGNLFDMQKVQALPHDAPGRDDDLLDKLELHLSNAIGLGDAVDIYVFGEPFPSGIHDVHMNQGSVGQFAGSNGVWQDGGLLLHDHEANRWTALFLAFQSQAIHTDDRDGDALPGSARFEDVVRGATPSPTPTPTPTPGPTPTPSPTPTPVPANGQVRIVAALVNPEGAEDRTGGELVTLINTGREAVSLAGWTLASSATSRMPLDGQIDAGRTLAIAVAPPLTLSNKGGILSILDRAGLKIHGVSYTRDQAQEEGITLVF